MKFRFCLLIAYIFLQASSCQKDHDPEPLLVESDHFLVKTNTALSNISEVNEIVHQAEMLYRKILQVFGERRAPKSRITILLEGDFKEQGPYFDHQGIHLFRYTKEENGYLALLAHEMVHAFRKDYYIEFDPWRWSNYPFMDEGLSEYVAQLIDPGKTGFPLYGYDAIPVVGDQVLKDNWIPNDFLRANHHEINDHCNIQAYPQRSTWMQFIDEAFGRDTLLLLNYPESAPTSAFFERTLGMGLWAVDSAWQSWIIDQYHRYPNAAQMATDFRQRTNWYSYCNY